MSWLFPEFSENKRSLFKRDEILPTEFFLRILTVILLIKIFLEFIIPLYNDVSSEMI